MKNLLLLILLFAGLSSQASGLKLTYMVNPDSPDEKYLILEGEDLELKKDLLISLSEEKSLDVFLQGHGKVSDNEGAFVGIESLAAPMIVRQNEFFDKDHAVRDCLIGAGTFIGGVVFVLATGEKREVPPSGLTANVGDTYVTDGAAGVTCALWVTSCVFTVKGVVELFKKGGKRNRMDARLDPNSEDLFLGTEDILEKTGFEKKGEWAFDTISEDKSKKNLTSYMVSLLY